MIDIQTEQDFVTDGVCEAIGVLRYYHFMDLNHKSLNTLQIAYKNPNTQGWSKWLGFYNSFTLHQFITEPDLHRSLLDNEIVIESDYPTYEENVDATRIMGAIIESKGFIPHYYYSGNKSIHIHVFLDFKSLLNLDMFLQNKIIEKFKAKKKFVTEFIEYLRGKLISCWDLNVRQFDTALIKGRHLIRSELSRNKLGYKTFLGYNYKDIKPYPMLCNPETAVKPIMGKMVLSNPHDIQRIVEEFLDEKQKKVKKAKIESKKSNLMMYLYPEIKTELKPCVKHILSMDRNIGDGYNRFMFILANELKQKLDSAEALVRLNDWNLKQGSPIKDGEIEYRIKNEGVYNLKCGYIQELLNEIGEASICAGCKHRKV